MRQRSIDIETIALQRSDTVPNNTLPALIYRNVFFKPLDGESLAQAFEQLFSGNGWPAAWRNGVFSYDHFHCEAHEVLGVYCGTAAIALGGDEGQVCVLRANDAVVIPAGVSHRRVRADRHFAVIGAYPVGQDMGVEMPSAERCRDFLARIGNVPRPSRDPVLGCCGALLDSWQCA